MASIVLTFYSASKVSTSPEYTRQRIHAPRILNKDRSIWLRLLIRWVLGCISPLVCVCRMSGMRLIVLERGCIFEDVETTWWYVDKNRTRATPPWSWKTEKPYLWAINYTITITSTLMRYHLVDQNSGGYGTFHIENDDIIIPMNILNKRTGKRTACALYVCHTAFWDMIWIMMLFLTFYMHV